MDSGGILDRIKTLSKAVKITMPEKVFYSGPNHSEVAVYFGDTKQYTDLIDFWISILFWVSNDKMEYDDISILNEKKEYPSKFNYYYEALCRPCSCWRCICQRCLYAEVHEVSVDLEQVLQQHRRVQHETAQLHCYRPVYRRVERPRGQDTHCWPQLPF